MFITERQNGREGALRTAKNILNKIFTLTSL